MSDMVSFPLFIFLFLFSVSTCSFCFFFCLTFLVIPKPQSLSLAWTKSFIFPCRKSLTSVPGFWGISSCNGCQCVSESAAEAFKKKTTEISSVLDCFAFLLRIYFFETNYFFRKYNTLLKPLCSQCSFPSHKTKYCTKRFSLLWQYVDC